MKIRFAVAAAAVLALAACGNESKPTADASDAPASSAASPAASTVASSEAVASPAAAPAKGDKPTEEFLVGKWGTDGDCTLAVDLRADGTSDGPFGNWSYSDGAITFADAPDLKVYVTVLDDQTMESKSAEGKTAKMTRCP
ncbi:hypothetical protein DVS77_11950 [Mycolicibacterium moriokaense]|nr:hypothetical protein DVS77_11950 [Mycolicibacterium moriokaense]